MDEAVCTPYSSVRAEEQQLKLVCSAYYLLVRVLVNCVGYWIEICVWCAYMVEGIRPCTPWRSAAFLCGEDETTSQNKNVPVPEQRCEEVCFQETKRFTDGSETFFKHPSGELKPIIHSQIIIIWWSPVVMYDCWEDANQKWFWDGRLVRSKLNNKYLQPRASSLVLGEMLEMADCHNLLHQHWTVDRKSDATCMWIILAAYQKFKAQKNRFSVCTTSVWFCQVVTWKSKSKVMLRGYQSKSYTGSTFPSHALSLVSPICKKRPKIYFELNQNWCWCNTTTKNRCHPCKVHNRIPKIMPQKHSRAVRDGKQFNCEDFSHTPPNWKAVRSIRQSTR